MTHAELIARLEAATGPDRELDKAVYAALGNCNHDRTEYYCIEDGNDTDSGFTCLDCGKDTYGAKSAPAYSASLDAAMMLVPEGCETGVSQFRKGDGAASLCDKKGKQHLCLKAATPALALCIASLKAQEQTQ